MVPYSLLESLPGDSVPAVNNQEEEEGKLEAGEEVGLGWREEYWWVTGINNDQEEDMGDRTQPT